MDIGPAELLIVLAVVLLLFGTKKLPELARGMGQASKEFRKGLHHDDDHHDDHHEAVEAAAAASDADPKDATAEPRA